MKPKLFAIYRMKADSKFAYNDRFPSEGIWETIGVFDLDTKNPYYKMRCVYPMHPERKHMQTLKVWKELIVKFMERVEIVPIKQ